MHSPKSFDKKSESWLSGSRVGQGIMWVGQMGAALSAPHAKRI